MCGDKGSLALRRQRGFSMSRMTKLLTGLIALSGLAGFSGSASAFTIDFGFNDNEPITVTSVPANTLLLATSVTVPSVTSDNPLVTALTISSPISLSVGSTVTISFDVGATPFTDTVSVTNVTRSAVGHEVDVFSAGDLTGDHLGPNVSELDFTFNQAGGTGNDISGSGTYTTSSIVPESSTWAMMLVGFIGLGYAALRRSSKGRALEI
jgi:hypothetical protein